MGRSKARTLKPVASTRVLIRFPDDWLDRIRAEQQNVNEYVRELVKVDLEKGGSKVSPVPLGRGQWERRKKG